MPPRAARANPAPRSSFLAAIAPRTALDVPALVQPCCLRCSKRIHRWSTDDGCAVTGTAEKKCEYCSRAHHACESIPAIYNAVVNSLIERKKEILALAGTEDELDTSEMLVFARAVARYQRDVEAHLRVQKKQHASRELGNSMDEHSKVFASLLGRLVETQEQLLDIRRAEVGLPARLSRATAASRPPIDPTVDEDDDVVADPDA